MNEPTLSIAFSPCPNDTFIFCGLVNGFIDHTGFTLGQKVFEDVETLNVRAFEQKYDITKLSFHAFGHLREQYSLLTVGSALGRGCGPLLVKLKNSSAGKSCELKKIAVPGKYTTAAMLLKLYLPEVQTIEIRFDKIMSSVANGEVDAGVIIHESRFTYQQYGLTRIVDLGDWWENETGCLIPLGGIALLKSHSEKMRAQIDEAIRESIKWAKNNRAKCMPYVKKHAQELDDSVVQNHISLYVNTYSENLGEEGKKAIHVFLEKGEKAGIFPCNTDKIF